MHQARNKRFYVQGCHRQNETEAKCRRGANVDNNTRLDYDEITHYLDTRYVCPPESIYRIFTTSVKTITGREGPIK